MTPDKKQEVGAKEELTDIYFVYPATWKRALRILGVIRNVLLKENETDGR